MFDSHIVISNKGLLLNGDIIYSAVLYIDKLFRGNNDGHDTEHSLRVYHNAMLIAETENDSDKEIIALASLLHDVDDHKLFNTYNNDNARTFLKNRISTLRIEKVCDCINSVSFSQNRGLVPNSIEGKIVQDADRLDAIGAIGIARTFAYGGSHNQSIEESIQHFYDKILLLKDKMNTDKAKQLATVRHTYLQEYLKVLEKELACEN